MLNVFLSLFLIKYSKSTDLNFQIMMKKFQYLFSYVLISLIFTEFLSAQHHEFWGMTARGGINGIGVIFKTDGQGEKVNKVFDFTSEHSGSEPRPGIMKALNGKYYGMTSYGGENSGVIYEFDPQYNQYSVLHNFESGTGNIPYYGTLTEGVPGKLYGMTYVGGTHGVGVIFEFNYITGQYTKKFDFDGPENGKKPIGGLIYANNGKLYGMTYQGGKYNKGVLFEFDPETDLFTKKLDFNGAENGATPWGSLIQATDGNLYGMTTYGGISNKGTIFRYDPVGDTLVKLVDLSNSTGSYPIGTLLQVGDHKLYGMTSMGGSHFDGVIFEYDLTTGTFTKKADFNGSNGSFPNGSLTEGDNGKLYGMTKEGGAGNMGVLFEYDPESGILSKEVDFDGKEKGSSPVGTLLADTSGLFYGTAPWGGKEGEGVFFSFDPSNGMIIKHFDFNDALYGKYPESGFIQSAGGDLFGMTSKGGDSGNGVIFKLDPFSGVYTKIFDFDGLNGSFPYGKLFQASDGKIYGLTKKGGINDNGVLFVIDPDHGNQFVKILDLDTSGCGIQPYGSLMEGSDGKLYGLTSVGGAHNQGVLFAYDPVNGICTPKFSFDGTNGSYPYGSLVSDGNDRLFGMTNRGGTTNNGVIFEYRISLGSLVKRFDFKGDNGSWPFGSLILTHEGKLAGITKYGGVKNMGVFFEYDTVADTLSVFIDFDGTAGSYSYGSLMESSDYKIYGLGSAGGSYGKGTIFRYDPDLDNLITTHDFQGLNGANPEYEQLLEIYNCSSASTINETSCKQYTSPSGKYTWTESGIYHDTLANVFGCDSIINIELSITHVDTSVVQSGDTLTANAEGAAYQWVDCNNGYIPVDGATGQNFVPLTNGDYAVVVTVNACTDTSSCYSLSPSAVPEKISAFSADLYPNPTNGDVVLRLGHPEKVIISITDIAGRKIQVVKGNAKKEIILPLAQWQRGIYFVTVSTDETYKVFKLIKK